jgi:hypothetical protein
VSDFSVPPRTTARPVLHRGAFTSAAGDTAKARPGLEKAEVPSPVIDWCGARHPVDLILIGTAVIAAAVGLVATL